MADEGSYASRKAVAELRSKATTLLESLRMLVARVGAADAGPGVEADRLAAEWLDQLEAVARQVRNLGKEVAPVLEHFVLRPTQPGGPNGPSPEMLLRTKLDLEMERADEALLARAADEGIAADVEVLRRMNDAMDKVLNAFKKNPAFDELDKQGAEAKRVVAANASANGALAPGAGAGAGSGAGPGDAAAAPALSPDQRDALVRLWRRGDAAGVRVRASAPGDGSGDVDEQILGDLVFM